jgi:TolB-like protein
MSFFEELKRRNVFRAGIAYLLVAWLVLQVTETVAPILELSAVFSKSVLLLLAIGFPVAVLFAWIFEMTPDGFRKETDVDRSVSISRRTGRNLDFIIIGVLSAAVAMFALDKFVWTESISPTATDVQQRIAVLPFVNLSDDTEQEYFSDGLSEELLNLLAQIPELRVTSRTSAFSFKGTNPIISEVGRALNVEHVLEGSVRRSGDTLRITAQLIEVSTDTHLWSETWDRNFADVFVIQDEIAESVVNALRIQLLGNVPRVFETTPEAYALYLQSQFLIEQRTVTSFLQAERITKRILEMDPAYAPAWSQLAFLYFSGSAFGAWNSVDAIPLARDAAQTSLRLFENNAQARAILVQIAMSDDFDYELAAAPRPSLNKDKGILKQQSNITKRPTQLTRSQDTDRTPPLSIFIQDVRPKE